jgi:hypothetical protein
MRMCGSEHLTVVPALQFPVHAVRVYESQLHAFVHRPASDLPTQRCAADACRILCSWIELYRSGRGREYIVGLTRMEKGGTGARASRCVFVPEARVSTTISRVPIARHLHDALPE